MFCELFRQNIAWECFVKMSKTTNKKQSEILLRAMELRPDIARGWFKGNKEDLNRVWRNLEVELNAAGPPSKTIGEWKKVWCDQKKNVRKKASQNHTSAKGTGGGPNMENKLSAGEEAIYTLISMKETVEGVEVRKHGLASSSATEAENLPPPLLELFEDNEENMLDDPHTAQKPPAKKKKQNAQSGTQAVLEEELDIQRKILATMVEQQQTNKKVYRSIDRLYDIKKAELREQKRHNQVIEELRLRKLEDNIEMNRRLMELEELKFQQR